MGTVKSMLTGNLHGRLKANFVMFPRNFVHFIQFTSLLNYSITQFNLLLIWFIAFLDNNMPSKAIGKDFITFRIW